MSDLNALMDQLKERDDERVLVAIRSLVDRVKAAEEDLDPEAVFAPVRTRLHQFVHLLFHPDPEISGCTISVTRRVRTDAAAVAALLPSLGTTLGATRALLAEGLGHAIEMTDALEDVLVAFLDEGTGAGTPGWHAAAALIGSRRASTAAALRLAATRGNPRADYVAALVEQKSGS